MNQAKQTRLGIHNLRLPPGAKKKKKILGRGSSSGHGKTSTRGSKGQTSRAGRATYPGSEGGQSPLIRRVPKRGFKHLVRKEFQVINLGVLNRIKTDIINPQELLKEGLIRKKDILVKILGDGELERPLSVSAHAFSRSAEEKIKAKGGKTELIHA